MRLLKLLLFTVFVTLTAVQCKSQKVENSAYKITTEAPFTIEKATFQKWVGGRPNTGGTNVDIFINNSQNIEFGEIYFRGKKVKIKSFENEKNRNGLKLVGAFKKQFKKDISLHSDPKKEYGNSKKIEIPFELKDKEAVISYKQNGKLKFFKVENLEELEPQYYP
ncbi:hypothetical protein [Aureivirga marina]|uniref:hypothetical protein n=1 Tax=Aureivirga marina TaxID=1182451 RepID=UPI0018C8EA90|nr:hypothetical protein [Aureivirga marina]